jgi:hypothetical protein
MQELAISAVLVLVMAAVGCDDRDSPSASSPDSRMATVRIVFPGATTGRTDLPPSVQACVNGVSATHIHPSWRSFAAIPLQAVPPDGYELGAAVLV